MRFFLVFWVSFFLFISSNNSSAQITRPQSESPVVFEEQPLITNVFYQTDIREVLAAISGQTGINIITDQTVFGFITLDIIDTPFEEALRRILSPLGFTFRKMEGYYFVGSAYPDNPSFPLLSVTERIVPNYIRAENIPQLLSDFYDPFINIDPKNNILTVTASPEIIQKIKQELAVIDVAPRQVMVEALITELSSDARKSLGIDATWLAERGGESFSIILPVGDILDSTFGLGFSKTDARAEGWVGDFKASFKALVQDGKVTIRANPRVATIEGQKAQIIIGKEQYYVIVTGTTAYSYGQLERIPVGVSLNIIPYVADNGDITVEIQPEVSDVVGTGATGLPVVSKRSVTTKVRVKDGETIVIGGLLQKNESIVKRKIPLLGDIPILGLLFSRTDKRVDEIETVVFITPHLLVEGEVVEGEMAEDKE
jgi:type II secretory pathway component GspD/PulD (secretin)